MVIKRHVLGSEKAHLTINQAHRRQIVTPITETIMKNKQFRCKSLFTSFIS